MRFTWEVVEAGVTFPRYSIDQRPMNHSQAVRYAQSEWSRQHRGVRVAEAYVRELPTGEWLPVEPASLCGATDLETGLPIVCHPVIEPDAEEDGEELPPPHFFADLALTGYSARQPLIASGCGLSGDEDCDDPRLRPAVEQVGRCDPPGRTLGAGPSDE